MKFKYTLFIATLVLSSCSNDFLELYPETSLNENIYYQSDDEFVLLVNASYIPLRDLGKNDHWRISEVKSDNMTYRPTAYTTQTLIDDFVFTSSSSPHENFWSLSYTGIYYCNTAITAIETLDYSWESQSLKNRSLGEVYFLRAMYYFNLVRQFGGIPLVTSNITGSEAVDVKRSTEEETYNLIISDLNTAINHLTNMGSTGENGRVNLGASQALLAKVHLTLHNYSEAAGFLEDVIQSGNFGLLENYADVFDPTQKDYYETLFSIQYSESTAESSNRFIFFNAPPTSKGEITNLPNITLNSGTSIQPEEELINAFELGDARLSVSIGLWTGPDIVGNTINSYYCAKYKGPQTATLDWSGDNFPVLRYSDVLLMYAEVLNEQGKTSEAIPFIQKVRSRANLFNDISGLSQDSIRQLIEKERQIEFCFENQRWYDLLRTGKGVEVLSAQGKGIQEYHLLAPIPGKQVLINNLEQNPGY